jgi:hypothetical protein
LPIRQLEFIEENIKEEMSRTHKRYDKFFNEHDIKDFSKKCGALIFSRRGNLTLKFDNVDKYLLIFTKNVKSFLKGQLEWVTVYEKEIGTLEKS